MIGKAASRIYIVLFSCRSQSDREALQNLVMPRAVNRKFALDRAIGLSIDKFGVGRGNADHSTLQGLFQLGVIERFSGRDRQRVCSILHPGFSGCHGKAQVMGDAGVPEQITRIAVVLELLPAVTDLAEDKRLVGVFVPETAG